MVARQRRTKGKLHWCRPRRAGGLPVWAPVHPTPMTRRKSQLQAELRQQRPFVNLPHELTIAVLRTASVVQRELDRALEGTGLSGAQYNVLRILRGAEPLGLPTLAVRDRLIAQAPGITRLVEKLARSGLVTRDRSTPDRRQVVCRISPAGTALLMDIEPRMVAAINDVGARLTSAEQRDCLALLDTLRQPQASRR